MAGWGGRLQGNGTEAQSAGQLLPVLDGLFIRLNLPASSATIAFPTGCVAPVTTQTKPYCNVHQPRLQSFSLLTRHPRSMLTHQLPITPVGIRVLRVARRNRLSHVHFRLQDWRGEKAQRLQEGRVHGMLACLVDAVARCAARGDASGRLAGREGRDKLIGALGELRACMEDRHQGSMESSDRDPLHVAAFWI